MTSGTRVSLLSSTDGRPFDDTIVSESCERSAVELSRGLEIETTFHIRQCRESGARTYTLVSRTGGFTITMIQGILT